MRTALFDYELPEACIAQRPTERREQSRLLALHTDHLAHLSLTDLVSLVPPGALLVLNDTRVLPARLRATQRTGGAAEVLLLRRLSEPGAVERWSALGRPARKLPPGTLLNAGTLTLRVLERQTAGGLTLELTAADTVREALEREGHMPLPPYVKRGDDALDRERYQTVFARHEGSVAAPTAGLHLTPELLAALEERGVQRAHITLHVGLGTFRPVTVEDLDDHDMHSEWLRVEPSVCEAVAGARRRGAPVVAVGTTVVRALETAQDPARPGFILPFVGETRLLIQPGYRFAVVDALLTNFHQPRSTLLALVSAFAGVERIAAAYAEALKADYRFLSYGDAMWIGQSAP